MKKIYAIIAAAAALVACTKAEEVSTPEIAEDQNSEITFNVNVGDFEPQTKAIKTGWEDGDVINLWFNDDIQEVPDLKMTYSNGKWTYGTLREGAYFNDSGYIKAIYESFNDLSNYRYDSGYFYTNHDDGAKIYTRHPMVLYTKQHTYTCSSNTVTADISDEWTFQSKIQIVVTGLDGDNAENYVLHCPQLRPINAFGLTERNATVSKGESGSKVTGVKNADGVAFYFFDNMNTTNGEYYDSFYFTLYEYSSSGMILSVKVYDVEGKSLTPTTQMCQGIKIDGSKFTMPEPEYVDLGLSVKWATFNVGAGKPEAYGDYYAWGETKTKSQYDWSTYFDNPSGDGETFTKYFDGAGKTVLDPEDDVAHVKWGGSWRIPTDVEWEELQAKCTWLWTDNYNGTGIAGRIVNGKGDYVKNSIFLPAVGYNNMTPFAINVEGWYWSSSPRSGTIYVWMLRFAQVALGSNFVNRYLGLHVRPVYGDPVSPSLPEDALSGEFSVSSTKKIHFSRGNLFATVNASGVPTAWGFQTAQYDYIGYAGANDKIGTTAGDVDLFGWSTPATQYGTSTTSSSYSTDSGDFKDWGATIDNNGTWRTLSHEEWQYLINTRSSAKDKWGFTEIDDAANGRTYRGLILLPDDWTKPESCSFTSGKDNGWKTNSYTMSQWSAMEKAGAVLLPLSGVRDGNSLESLGSFGYYWSSAYRDATQAYVITFGSEADFYYIPKCSGTTREKGCAVRLVTDVND